MKNEWTMPIIECVSSHQKKVSHHQFVSLCFTFSWDILRQWVYLCAQKEKWSKSPWSICCNRDDEDDDDDDVDAVGKALKMCAIM